MRTTRVSYEHKCCTLGHERVDEENNVQEGRDIVPSLLAPAPV